MEAEEEIRVLIIGITGPTGAGKTTVLQEVEKLGGGVIDCDTVYHELLESNIALQSSLEKEFGPLRDNFGRIDRKKLGAIVFSDAERLETLNSIAWKAVTDQVRALLEEFQKQKRQLAAVDAIALLESPLKNLCQFTVAVLAPSEMRVRRIILRESISKEYAWARVKAQRPDEYFSQNCDYTLNNDCAAAAEFSKKAQKFLREVILNE